MIPRRLAFNYENQQFTISKEDQSRNTRAHLLTLQQTIGAVAKKCTFHDPNPNQTSTYNKKER